MYSPILYLEHLVLFGGCGYSVCFYSAAKVYICLSSFKICRRLSAKCLLESPYFPTTVKASYLFLAPLQLLAKHGSQLRYAATFAMQGAFKAMGPFAAEMSAPYCLSLVVAPLSDVEAEWAYTLLKEIIKSLKPKSVKTMILPAMQKILQASN